MNGIVYIPAIVKLRPLPEQCWPGYTCTLIRDLCFAANAGFVWSIIERERATVRASVIVLRRDVVIMKLGMRIFFWVFLECRILRRYAVGMLLSE